jgi:TolB-like protein
MRVSSSIQTVTLGVAMFLALGCASSADRINSLSTELSHDLAKAAPSSPKLCVAVVPFTDKTRQAGGLSLTLRERITNQLAQEHVFNVVDQANLDQVLRTLKVQDQMYDAMDRSTLARLHELVGAQAIVVGSITDARSDFDVMCRLVDVSKNIVLASASSSIAKNDVLASADEDAPDTALQPMLAPIALYPDPLIANILPASTYPAQVHAAAAWTQTHLNATDEQIATNDWDPSVQALAHYPSVVKYMDADPQWTESLGAAVVSEQPQVLATIQDLRAQARRDGSLVNSADQRVEQNESTISLMPTSQVIAVPVYDPVIVYQQATFVSYQYYAGWRSGPPYELDWNRSCLLQNSGTVASPNGYARPIHTVWIHNERIEHLRPLTVTGHATPRALVGRTFAKVPQTHTPSSAVLANASLPPRGALQANRRQNSPQQNDQHPVPSHPSNTSGAQGGQKLTSKQQSNPPLRTKGPPTKATTGNVSNSEKSKTDSNTSKASGDRKAKS